MPPEFWTTAGLVLLALIALANLWIMALINTAKEKRQDERAEKAEKAAAEREKRNLEALKNVKNATDEQTSVVQKLGQHAASAVSAVAQKLIENPPLSKTDVLPIAQSIDGMKDELVREVRRSVTAEGKAEGLAESQSGVLRRGNVTQDAMPVVSDGDKVKVAVEGEAVVPLERKDR